MQSTPTPQFKCRSKDPMHCTYHGAFIRMDAAAQKGDMEAFFTAREQAEQYNNEKGMLSFFKQEETTSVVGLDSVIDGVQTFFARFKKQTPEQAEEIAVASAVQQQPKIMAFKNMEGFLNTENMDPDTVTQYHALDEEMGIRSQFRKTLAESKMAGEIPIVAEEHARYYYNPDLRNARPTLEGWKAENTTHAYMVQTMLEAIESQRDAMFENSGLETSPFDRFGAEAVVTGVDDREDSGIISNYDEGWMYAFYVGLEDAKKTSFPETNTPQERDAVEKTFVKKQREYWEQQLQLQSGNFNEGAHDAWHEWN